MSKRTHIIQVRVAIIGAGSAGLSAFRAVNEQTRDVVLIDPGPLGTKCARTGCMPSKALIRTANDFHRRHVFDQEGIRVNGALFCDLPGVFRHVRSQRDFFTEGMQQTTIQLAGPRLIQEKAILEDMHTILAGNRVIEAQQIIIAAGADPVIPEAWRDFSDRILTSETIFEQETLPPRMAVIGLGPIGLELGQALSRLGVDITGFGRNPNIGGLRDGEVSEILQEEIAREFPLFTDAEAQVESCDSGTLRVTAAGQCCSVDSILLAVGVRPNINELNLGVLGVELDDSGLPRYDPHTGQVEDLPVYLAGDTSGDRTILHEALDEGFIAGINAARAHPVCADRRVPLRICFSDPQAVSVGRSYRKIREEPHVVGVADFRTQSRAVIEGRNCGRMHLYAEPQRGRLLGAELAAPEAEHMGHLIALALQQQMTVHELLRMPFYHPTLTEALRAALRDAADACAPEAPSPACR